MNSNVKNLVIPTILMVIIFVVLVMGATYAYFNVNTTNNGTTTKTTTTAESVGLASLLLNSNLQLKLTQQQMMQSSDNIEYYATIDGNPVTSENSVAIATASVNGNGTMECNYEFKVEISGTNSMYDAFLNMKDKSDNQLVLNVEGKDYDLNDTAFPVYIAGTITDLKDGIDKEIMASFKIVNRKDIDQSDLAGTDLKITFNVNAFNCYLVG